MSVKLELAIAIALSAPSFSALGLGLGEIETYSSLNQKFNAQIELLSVQPEELENIHVKLAPRKTFEQIGLDHPALLRSLRFSTEQQGKNAYITVKSDRLIREPFLGFLIEVHWPTGKLVREYTVLLDPPIALAPHEGKPIRSSAQSRPAHEIRATRISIPEAQHSVQHQALNQVVVQSEKPKQHTGDKYGPVESGESLSKIALKVRHNDISIEQMTVALWKANPNAFIKNNIDLLKAGSTLRVPTSEETIKLTRINIRNEGKQQQVEIKSTEKNENTASPVVTKEIEVDSNSYQLRLVSGNPEAETSSVNDKNMTLSELRNQLQLINEKVESYRIENESLKNHVHELTEQLTSKQQPPSVLTIQSIQTGNNSEIPTGGEQKASVSTPEESNKFTTTTTAPIVEKSVASFDIVLDKIWWLAGFLILGLSAWLGLGRQNKEHIEPTEQTETLVPEAADTPVDDTTENKIVSIQSTPEHDTEDEPDFMIEVEHCIVYGHYDRAETLLKQALEDQQQKTVIRYKLIDVYYAAQNIEALNEVIDSIVSAGEEDVDSDAWERAMEMCAELASENKIENEKSEQSSLKGDYDHIDPNWSFGNEETKDSNTSEKESDANDDSSSMPKLKVASR